MGLDMYAYAVPASEENTDFAYKQQTEGQERNEIAYWRKFNALHGWMEDLYRSLGGEKLFNCIPLKLTTERLDILEAACRENTLHPREGFFFGSQEIYEEDIDVTLSFIKRARACIEAGEDVYYDSWW